MAMIKKKQMTNKLYGSNGGWAAMRSINYGGTAHVYGMPYHQIDPIISSFEWNEMIAWCVSIFGPSGTPGMPGVWTPGDRWYVNNAKFLFRDKVDCEWFMLRWS
jgi:hypothetical protein